MSASGRAKGILYLIPTNLSEPANTSAILPSDVIDAAVTLRHYIAENAKSARAFLKAIGLTRPLLDIQIKELNKHAAVAKDSAADELIQPLLDGYDVGLVSDAGAPAVADPGALVVAAAHRHGICVRPLVGPSSILLGLMASGLNGQCFAFHGYLPQDKLERTGQIQLLERESKQRKMTQLFIETPYRNQSLLQDLLATLLPQTRLCIASDITGSKEKIETKSIAEWRSLQLASSKSPTLFLFLA